ncbi:unnamed protein product [Prorocentrum cordatum]|uniref:Uncharacterized protein n=1 Tax=Prorocentrum cordatum TaxID=2364126 RepID=A0ABN9UPU3_9DINO|nr:unnamed protein product [Polarella glacialis]
MQLAVLAYLNSPDVLLSIVFLLLANRRIKFTHDTQCVEYFAGVAAVCKAFASADHAVYAYEILKAPVMNDILSDIGFAEAVRVALNTAVAGCCVLGPACSSWVHLSMGSSGRRKWRPLGDQKKLFVKKANLMVSRVILLVRILHSRGVFWVLEQPMSSLMVHHPRFQEAIKDLGIHSVRIYMGNFGAKTEKGTTLYSNCPEVKGIGGQKRPTHMHNNTKKLVDEFVDASGCIKVTGNSELKQSQASPCACACGIYKIWAENRGTLVQRHRGPQKATLDAGMEVNIFGAPSTRKEAWHDAKLDGVVAYLQK